MKEVYEITKFETVDCLRVEKLFLQLDDCKKVVDSFLKESTNGEISLVDIISADCVCQTKNYKIVRKGDKDFVDFTIYKIIHTMKFEIKEV